MNVWNLSEVWIGRNVSITQEAAEKFLWSHFVLFWLNQVADTAFFFDIVMKNSISGHSHLRYLADNVPNTRKEDEKFEKKVKILITRRRQKIKEKLIEKSLIILTSTFPAHPSARCSKTCVRVSGWRRKSSFMTERKLDGNIEVQRMKKLSFQKFYLQNWIKDFPPFSSIPSSYLARYFFLFNFLQILTNSS